MARPLVISHRTNMGSQSENSIEGIVAALADGVDGIEIDVRASADGVPMLLHDAALERTHGDARALAALTTSEASALGVPTLDAALTAINGRTTLYIEVKERGLGAAVARAVRAARGTSWCWVWAFDPMAAAECRAALPEVPVALNSSSEAAALFGYESAAEVAVREGFAAISLDRRLVTHAIVEEAHGLGLLVFTWTLDEPADIEAVVASGVDGVCGNYPKRIRKVIDSVVL